MPRIRQYEEKYAQDDFLKEIGSRCVWAGFQTNEDLGKAIGVSAASAGNYKRDPGRIRLDTMQLMVKKLKLDPGIVLRFLGYSNNDIRTFAKEYIQ